jgi:hypothetical protein
MRGALSFLLRREGGEEGVSLIAVPDPVQTPGFYKRFDRSTTSPKPFGTAGTMDTIPWLMPLEVDAGFGVVDRKHRL